MFEYIFATVLNCCDLKLRPREHNPLCMESAHNRHAVNHFTQLCRVRSFSSLTVGPVDEKIDCRRFGSKRFLCFQNNFIKLYGSRVVLKSQELHAAVIY